MTQPHLLEHAKQGDPDSIAALMNLALQSKGITAQAWLQDACLEVRLNSERALNAIAMVEFVQKGLVNLGLESIQTVKVYGQKMGESSPTWVEEIAIQRLVDGMSANPTGMTTETGQVGLVHHPRRSPRFRGIRGMRRWLWFQARAGLDQVLSIAESATFQLQRSPLIPARLRSSKYAMALVVATLPAFLLGAIAAVIATSAQGTSNQTQTPLSANQIAAFEVSPEQLAQQTEVRKYLDKMNRAQRNFYLKNGRFAANLEELERSAKVISLLTQKNDYTYKLAITRGTQSQLTAKPNIDGLKSFTGAVLVVKPESGTKSAVIGICESQQPTKIPPVLEAPKGSQVQCPTNAVKSG